MQTLARDIMTKNVIAVNLNTTVEEAIQLFIKHGITGMPVTDKKGHVVGVVSELDILKSIDTFMLDQIDQRCVLTLERTIEFTHKVTTIAEETPLSEIMKLFIERRIRRVPVLSAKGRLVGIISRRDIMRILYYRGRLAKLDAELQSL